MSAPKVLLIRFSSIGDIVLTTPVVRAIKRQTQAEIHFLTKQSFAAVLKGNPYVDRLWVIKKDVREVAAALLDERFTHLIDLHDNLRSLEVKIRLGIFSTLHLRPRPRTATFNKLNFRKFLLTRLGRDRLPQIHIVDRYLAAASFLDVTKDGEGLDYFVAAEDQVDLAKEQLPKNYLAFVIGAAHATKRLTEGQMVAFCQALPHPVILLGGPAEAAAGDRIAAQCAQTVNACGRFSLAGSADLVRRARVVVTHDTGLMHIAAAFRKPILSVWGNTVPAFGMYPYLPGEEGVEKQWRQEVHGLSCRPCSKIGYQRCPQGHFRCIREHQPAEIVRRAQELLRLNAPR